MAPQRGQHPLLSVIVPTFNRCERLRRLLRGLEHAGGPRPSFEVVITVDGSVDGTLEMLDALQPRFPLRVLQQPNRGPAAARNRALEAALGEVLLFLDDDVVPTTGLLEQHLRVHQQDPDAVVIGPMLPPPGRTLAPWLRWEAVTLQKQYAAMIAGYWAPTPRQFYTANASVRRQHALAAGGFDERMSRAEDVEFAYRLAGNGLRFYFVPSARVVHEPDRTFASWLRVGYEYGRHDVFMTYACGHRHVLGLAYRERERRHPLSRRLTRWVVGHRVRRQAALALGYAGLHLPFKVSERAQLALCGALFNVQYWQGVADATRTDAAVHRTIT